MDAIDGKLRHLRRYTEMLFADPVGFSKKLGSLSITGTYAVPARKEKITEAVALWSAFYADSRFYLEIKHRLYDRYRKSDRAEEGFESNYREAVRKNIGRLRLHQLLKETDNIYVRVFCMYMLLPERVARRWLWHENIDFQSPESFLRRLTNDKVESLKKHYDISQNGYGPERIYPCFKDGTLNRVWDFFGLTAKDEDRMATKSALAHDFLGFNMGFQKYLNIDSDAVASSELTSQFLSSQDRGAFEVNKGPGGLYWYLYRTLRSNRLWNKGAEVKLGEWICPGFWFTMALWVFMLVGSPLCLVAFAACTLLGVSPNIFGIALNPVFGVVGAVSPVLYAAGWGRENFSKGDFAGDYWPNFGGTLLFMAAGFVFAAGFMFLRGYFAYWAFLLCLLFLIPYRLKAGTESFWKAKYIGKLLPALLLAAVAQDLWRHTQFWEFCWNVLVLVALAIAAFFVENLWGILQFLAVAAMYIGLLTAAIVYVGRTQDRMRTHVAKGSVETERDYRREELVSYAFMVAGIAFMACIGFYMLYVQFVFAAIMGFALAAPFAGFAFDVGMGKLDPKVAMVKKEFGERDLHAGSFLDSIARTVAANPFWFKRRPLRLRSNDLFDLWMGHHHVHQFLMFVSAIGSEDELKRAVAFLNSSEYSLIRSRLILQGLFNEWYLQSILQGTLREDLERVVSVAYKTKIEKKQRRETRLEKAGAALKGAADAVLGFLWMLCYPFRLMWRGIRDLWQLWQDFNKNCPRRPDVYAVFR
jgi:hypothetical protein